MPTTLDARTGSMAAVDEAFMELVCGDEQLLRSEFDSIIAREWPTRRPPGGSGALARGTGPRPRRRLLPGWVGRLVAGQRHPVGNQHRRERSPPAASGATTTPRHSTRPVDEGR